jgi:putative chitinase
MPIQLTEQALRKIFPKAPQAVLDDFMHKQHLLDKAGVNHTRTRLAHFFANIEHETGGFTIPNLTESTKYSAKRACQVWPSRYHSEAECYQKVGSWAGDPDFGKKLLDVTYGGRMGNRPGTHDGSNYIGRGGPQWTGRDGYLELERRTGLPAVSSPEVAARLDKQTEVCTAFWDWKRLNETADAGNLKATRKRWNGGYIGMADVESRLQGNDPYIKVLQNVESNVLVMKTLPGEPPTKVPPPEVVKAATDKERKVIATSTLGEAATVGTKTVTEQETKPMTNYVIEWTLIGAFAAAFIVAVVLIYKKREAIKSNWF